MRIAWLTPFSDKSAIAEYSRHVTGALADWCEVDLWVSDSEEPQQTSLRTIDLASAPERLARLAQYDVVVHNIGDHLGYHGAIVEAMRAQPGVVVLHDRSCHNLFAGYWIQRGERETYVQRMEVLYGPEAGAAAAAALRGERPHVWDSDEDVLRYPLADEALVGALGAVAHSADHARQLRERWFGPVGELFLPSYGRPAPPPRSEGDGTVTLLTLGYVNRNKQVHRMLEVLGRNPDLAARVRYLVVGPGLREDYAEELEGLQQRYGLDSVSFLGYQPEEEVERLLAEADICVNLRYPALEGASASLMRQLELGRPVLANDVGGFAELPEGSLVRVPPEDDDALAAALRRLVDDPQLRASVGAAAREAAGKRSLDRYAREFLAFVEEVRSWTPIVRTIDLAAFELGRMGVDERFGEIGRIAHELGTIVDAMAPEPLLRLLGPEDLVALKLFFRENNTPAVTTNFHPFPLSDEVAEDIGLRAGRDRYFGAFARGRLVGLSMLRGWNEGFDIPSFGIAVDHREHGKGIGQALTDFTLDRAPWLGAEQVRLTVYASNRVAHAMYVGRGFEEQSREPVTLDGGADERIVMVKELTGTVQTEVGA